MEISKEEAARALAAVQQANAATRSAVRAHHGHLHLWLWGLVWIAMALLAHTRGLAGVRLFPWLSGAGVVGSLLIGAIQHRQVRAPVDRRFLGALGALVGFALLFPLVLHSAGAGPEAAFAYTALVVAQAYVVSGLWFGNYFTWFGLLLAALILVGFFAFPAIFWLWIAVCTGGAFLLTGCYVRFFWR